MLGRFLSAILLSWGVALVPASVEACTCIGGISTLEDELKAQPLLIAGRINETLASVVPGHVAAVQVRVLEVVRGREPRSTVTIWDQVVNGSCSLELDKLKVGSFIVLAVNPAEERLRELWQYSGITPDPKDLLFGTCRNPWQTFETEAELMAFIERFR